MRKPTEALIHAPRAIWLGLLFVLSAGFAREYDAESLLHEPWYVLIPIPASLATSFILYGLLYTAANAKGAEGRGFWELYPTFLTLYWMTAPLAWLYAIPVERFMPAFDAAAYNYAFLGIVSLCRVALITRASSILFTTRSAFTFSIVMWFADTVMTIAAIFMPKPILSIMGGVELSETESLTLGLTNMVMFIGGASWLIWLFAMLHQYSNAEKTSTFPVRTVGGFKISSGTWAFAVCSLLVWGAILPMTQPEQKLRYEVERELNYGDLHRGLAMMSAHKLADFPPHWMPPPRLGYGEDLPNLDNVFLAILDDSVADWVADIYWGIGEQYFRGVVRSWGYSRDSDLELDAYLTHFERRAPREDFLKELKPELEHWAESLEDDADAESRTRAARVRKLLERIPADEGEASTE